MPAYKLSYFNTKGRAENARMMFAVAGVNYEDRRIERPDWPEIKPTTPLGSVPLLEVDGKPVVTSQAINRYLAREFKLYGKNNKENTTVDIVCEVMMDMFNPMVTAAFTSDEKVKEEILTKLLTETAPKLLGFLEKKLEENNGGKSFFVGNSVTMADIGFFTVMESFLIPGKNENGLDKFPKLKALKDRVAAQKQIAAWIKARPQTPY